MDAAGQGKGRPASAASVCLSVCLRGWEVVFFPRVGSDSAGEGRRAELLKGTSREVPRLLCHVK